MGTLLIDVLCIIHLFAYVYLQEGPCTNNMLLDENDRSIDYMMQDNDYDQCDRMIIEGWYRILNDGNIATTCPSLLRCGSTSPIWLNGTLPTRPNERVNITACVTGFGGCCEFSFQIEVRNCANGTSNNFNVFKLVATPFCPGRYCTEGPPAPCPLGKASETGFEPCEPLGINFTVRPVVKGIIPKLEGIKPRLYDERKLAFICVTSMPDEYKRYLFDIEWYLGGNDSVAKRKHKMNFDELNLEGIFYQEDWTKTIKHLGFWVKCAIRARGNESSPPTSYYKSEAFYAGVRLDRTVYHVESGSTVDMYIRSTVPVYCTNDCKIRFELFSYKEQINKSSGLCNSTSTIAALPSNCGAIIDGEKWYEKQKFSLFVAHDTVKRPSYTCKAKYKAASGINCCIWTDFYLPEITIHASNSNYKPGSVCKSITDPQITTFDNVLYTALDTGEFVLYRHKTKPIEVHTIHSKDNAVNCAFIVRAASDMFAIYGCEESTRWIKRRLNCDYEHQYLEIYNKGHTYEIVLPTGTRIVVSILSSWLDIYIYASPEDWNQTEGLCGTYNGNTADDYTDSETNIVDKNNFIKSWGVLEPNSLFIAKRRKEKMDVNSTVMYCSCLEKHITKEKKLDQVTTQADCTWRDSLPSCKQLNWKEDKCQIRGKREAVDDFELDVPVDLVEFKKREDVITWRNGWTEQKAMEACMTYSNQSKLFITCTKNLKINPNLVWDTCVQDIKISGSNLFMSASLDVLKSACMNELRVNPKYWIPLPAQTTDTESMRSSDATPDLSTVNPHDLLRERETSSDIDNAIKLTELIYNVICPNDCSNAGTCLQGICSCIQGFAGDDCSVNTTRPLDLGGPTGLSLCDTSKRPCSHMSFFSKSLYDSDTIKCRIKTAK